MNIIKFISKIIYKILVFFAIGAIFTILSTLMFFSLTNHPIDSSSNSFSDSHPILYMLGYVVLVIFMIILKNKDYIVSNLYDKLSKGFIYIWEKL